jgi:hypothetical protein
MKSPKAGDAIISAKSERYEIGYVFESAPFFEAYRLGSSESIYFNVDQYRNTWCYVDDDQATKNRMFSAQQGSSTTVNISHSDESINDPKPKHILHSEWKGSQNLPYNPDIDDIDDYRWR